MNMAEERVAVMSEEELSDTLDKINAAVEESQNKEASQQEEESVENTEEAAVS